MFTRITPAREVIRSRNLGGAVVEYSDVLKSWEKLKGAATERSVGDIGSTTIIGKVCGRNSHGKRALVDLQHVERL